MKKSQARKVNRVEPTEVETAGRRLGPRMHPGEKSATLHHEREDNVRAVGGHGPKCPEPLTWEVLVDEAGVSDLSLVK